MRINETETEANSPEKVKVVVKSPEKKKAMTKSNTTSREAFHQSSTVSILKTDNKNKKQVEKA